VSVAVKKMDGVESVDVSLEKASADISLDPDNKITIESLRRAIRSNGYQTKDAVITARGRFVERDGSLVFDLLNGSSLDLAERPKAIPEGEVELTGVLKVQPKGPDVLIIQAVK